MEIGKGSNMGKKNADERLSVRGRVLVDKLLRSIGEHPEARRRRGQLKALSSETRALLEALVVESERFWP
jgi:hypothetical protein